jgi:hypothetical protein
MGHILNLFPNMKGTWKMTCHGDRQRRRRRKTRSRRRRRRRSRRRRR